MFDNSEQWKSSGNCKDCRRQEYCKQKCTAWKKRQDRIIHDVAASLSHIKLLKHATLVV